MARGETLSENERLDLVFLPLMAHRRSFSEVVAAALALARALPETQQRQAMGALLGLAYHYVGQEALDRLMESLMGTSVLETVLANSMEQGMARAKRDAVLKVLRKRFGPVPDPLAERIGALTNLDHLDAIFDLSLSALALDEVTQALGSPPLTG